jgi:hypothetical protein
MSDLVVKPVRSRAERKEFLHYPWALYAHDPLWMPPLLMSRAEELNFRRSPFYDDAEVQPFLAQRSGKTVGRIAAIVNHAHTRRHKEERGFSMIILEFITNSSG